MNRPMPDVENNEPLDPAMEKVRRKMVRLLAVSIGTLLIGLMAVLGAIVYKAGGGSDVPSEAYRASLDVPDGFEVRQANYGDGRILIFGSDGSGMERILIYDLASGGLVADHVVE